MTGDNIDHQSRIDARAVEALTDLRQTELSRERRQSVDYLFIWQEVCFCGIRWSRRWEL